MIETILIARDRKTGKDVLLAGREVPFRKQLDTYKDLCGSHNDTYSTVALAQVQPHKKPLKFVTKAESDARKKDAEEAEKLAKATAEKEAAKTAKPPKSPKPPKGGPEKESVADEKEAAKTENQTGTDAGTKSE
ncbi:MAG: hypothetical protein QM813_26330 [Verrucomicrobiota bacterium]